MFYSGLIVTCETSHWDEVCAAVGALEQVEVHQTDASVGKIIVVLEAQTVGEEADIFERIRKMPHVVDVSLVVHRQEEDEVIEPAAGSA
ncbi:MAG: chaperone NapD [Duodenibacillus sp.]|nr:chaperone NapD [Duodenibacillus sp.]